MTHAASRRRPAGAALLAAALLALALAGCGAGAGPGLGRAVQLRVTTGFGSELIGVRRIARPPEADSVMTLTQKYFTVDTSYGGGFVDSIDGNANDDSGSEKLDWFYYVNGVQAPAGAASTQLRAGDRVWWDLHDWRGAASVPAVVGSFPEPFISDGPTVVVCAGPSVAASCRHVSAVLRRAGARLYRPGNRVRRPFIQVLVGTEAQLLLGQAGKLLADAPSQSGVYACFRDGGSELELENPAGHRVDDVDTAVGLIAAMQLPGTTRPTWVISGTDSAGVSAAAADLSAAKLADHFAVAVSGTAVLALPQSPQS